MTIDPKKKYELAKRSENIQFISLLARWKRICHVCALHLFKCRKTNDDKTRTLNEPATEKVTWICRRPRRINYNTIISILTEELCYTNTLARTESVCRLRDSYFKDPNKSISVMRQSNFVWHFANTSNCSRRHVGVAILCLFKKCLYTEDDFCLWPSMRLRRRRVSHT